VVGRDLFSSRPSLPELERPCPLRLLPETSPLPEWRRPCRFHRFPTNFSQVVKSRLSIRSSPQVTVLLYSSRSRGSAPIRLLPLPSFSSDFASLRPIFLRRGILSRFDRVYSRPYTTPPWRVVPSLPANKFRKAPTRGIHVKFSPCVEDFYFLSFDFRSVFLLCRRVDSRLICGHRCFSKIDPSPSSVSTPSMEGSVLPTPRSTSISWEVLDVYSSVQ